MTNQYSHRKGGRKSDDSGDQVSRSPDGRRDAAAKNTLMVRTAEEDGHNISKGRPAKASDLKSVDIRDVTEAAKPGKRMRVEDVTTRNIRVFDK